MQDLSRSLSRNANRLAGADLWLDLPPDAPLKALRLDNARLLNQDYGAYRRLQATGAPVRFGAFPDPAEGRPERIVLCLPREKDRLIMLARCCAALLAPGGTLWLAGENRAGARSAAKRLRGLFETVEKRDSARHCTLWAATEAAPGMDCDPETWHRRHAIEVDACGERRVLEIHSWPGVFARGELDPGTEQLLAALPRPPGRARVLDFACGTGIIGAALAGIETTIDLEALDSSALACLSTRETFRANGVEGKVFASDGFSEARGRYDLIVSNPPFHQGHRTDPALTPRLLTEAGNFLAPGGQLVLVANRHLPYARWLKREFTAYECLASDRSYHVHRARR